MVLVGFLITVTTAQDVLLNLGECYKLFAEYRKALIWSRLHRWYFQSE